jgi:hypothetical protein
LLQSVVLTYCVCPSSKEYLDVFAGDKLGKGMNIIAKTLVTFRGKLPMGIKTACEEIHIARTLALLEELGVELILDAWVRPLM